MIRVNTLRPRQNGRHFADDIFKCIFLNENVWISIKISLKFVPEGPINNILALVQIMAWRRPGDKPLSEPMMVILLTHIHVTRPQWVKMPLLLISAWASWHIAGIYFQAYVHLIHRWETWVIELENIYLKCSQWKAANDETSNRWLSALAMGLCLSCTNPWKWFPIDYSWMIRFGKLVSPC